MRYRTLLAAILASLVLTACTSATGTNPVGTEGQTLGGYVASGAIDPDNARGSEAGDDDETPTGAPEETEPESEPPPPPI